MFNLLVALKGPLRATLVSFFAVCLFTGCHPAAATRTASRGEAGAAGGGVQQQTPTPFASPAQVSFVLSVEEPVWEGAKPAAVTLRINPPPGAPRQLEGLAGFKLIKLNAASEEEEIKETYYALVDLHAPQTAVLKPFVSSLTFESGEAFQVNFDLKKMKWGRSIAAGWPRQEFRPLVPPGSYKLVFDMRLKPTPPGPAPAPVRLNSNEVTVTVK